MASNDSRLQLISQIGEYSFYMDDIRLFLDTHPTCSEAIADYNKYQKLRTELMQEYMDRYGELTSYCSNADSDDWLWCAYPWPWEGVC